MVHIVSCARYQSKEDIIVGHFAYLFNITPLNEIDEVLNNISCMDLCMIKVISIRHLKSECQTFVFFQIYGKNIGGPSKLVITVHKGEVKQISSGHWVNK